MDRKNEERCCRGWGINELKAQLRKGIEYYLRGKDKSKSTYKYVAPIYHCPDGHIVRSMAELIIDLWLNLHNIEHVYDKKVYFKGDLNLVCDFYLPKSNTYIEYWGMDANESYQKRKDEKLHYYKVLNLNLISLYPADLLDLNMRLKNILLSP